MMIVRRAETRDAEPAISLLHESIVKLCVADHHNDAETIAQWLANKTPQKFFSWCTNKDHYCVVAESSNRLLLGIGLIHCSGEIHLCYVATGLQRQGIGSTILAALEEKALDWGLSVLRLQSTVSARCFYQSIGYRPTGTPTTGFGVSYCYPYAKTIHLNP